MPSTSLFSPCSEGPRAAQRPAVGRAAPRPRVAEQRARGGKLEVRYATRSVASVAEQLDPPAATQTMCYCFIKQGDGCEPGALHLAKPEGTDRPRPADVRGEADLGISSRGGHSSWLPQTS